jgi:hypothetical protein
MVSAAATANATSIRYGNPHIADAPGFADIVAVTERWSTPNWHDDQHSMMKATPKKNAMPRTPASLPRFSNVS